MNEPLITAISSTLILGAAPSKLYKEPIRLLLWSDGLLSNLRDFSDLKEFLLMRLVSVMRFELVKASDYFSRMTIFHQGQASHQRSCHALVKTGQVYFFSGGNFNYGLIGSEYASRLT